MPGVVTIPAGVPFVEALAAGLLAEADGAPPALADVLVLLPTRRACRLLAEAFVRRSGGRALLLPRIQPLGELDAAEVLLEGGLELALPPAIGPLRRQWLLARLFERAGWRATHALRLADELAALLDELQTERVPLAALSRLVPDHLAEHWQKNQAVLAVIAEAWPQVLAGEGALDPAERRHRLLSELAAAWRAAPPAARVVAAGSTGSIPATRALLGAIAALPRGTVVLPGLDQEMDEASWRSLDPGHPQYGLRQLLEALGVERATVGAWSAPAVAGTTPARARLLGEVMRPAATIAAWQHLPPPAPAAMRGLAIEQHPDLPGEALALALRMRAALETPALTAALVTRDRQLARRVAAELHRWGIEVDDSAGTPLDQTPPGAFLLLTARLVVEGLSPVALLAALKHPLAGGQDRAAFRERVRALELACLRGPRLSGGFSGILAELAREERRAKDDRARQRFAASAAFVRDLAQLARPFRELAEKPAVDLAALLSAHLEFAEALAGAALWAREAGEAAAALGAELLDAVAADRIAPAAYPAVLAQLMAARPVRSRAPKHPRLRIWGQLEARLQHADLLLLGGLNEGTWPALADPGPWLSGGMREALGLSPIERRIGLAAHDFVEAACARRCGALARREGRAGQSDRAQPLARAPADAARQHGWRPRRGSPVAAMGPPPRPRGDRAPRAASGADAARGRPAAGAVGERHLLVDERSLCALRQAHPEARAAGGARGRSRRAGARHRHPPGARALRQGPRRRPARRRGAAPARHRPAAVRGFQPSPAGQGAVVAALRADRPLGDRARARAPSGQHRDPGRGRGRPRGPGRRAGLPAQGAGGPPRAASRRSDHGE